MKLKYLLPAANIVLRLLLLRWNQSLWDFGAPRCDAPGPSGVDRLLVSMNIFLPRDMNLFLGGNASWPGRFIIFQSKMIKPSGKFHNAIICCVSRKESFAQRP
jgi:hypothetical protein